MGIFGRSVQVLGAALRVYVISRYVKSSLRRKFRLDMRLLRTHTEEYGYRLQRGISGLFVTALSRIGR